MANIKITQSKVRVDDIFTLYKDKEFDKETYTKIYSVLKTESGRRYYWDLSKEDVLCEVERLILIFRKSQLLKINYPHFYNAN